MVGVASGDPFYLNCKAFIGLTIRAKIIGGGRPLLCENLVDADPPVCIARSVSAVTRSEKSLINTNRKSTRAYALSSEPKMNIVRCS